MELFDEMLLDQADGVLVAVLGGGAVGGIFSCCLQAFIIHLINQVSDGQGPGKWRYSRPRPRYDKKRFCEPNFQLDICVTRWLSDGVCQKRASSLRATHYPVTRCKLSAYSSFFGFLFLILGEN